MSGKGQSGSSGVSSSSSGGQATQSSSTTSSSSSGGSSQPTVVSGHEYHTYSQSSYGAERYSYIGKDDNGTPEFIDYGRKGDR